MKHASGLYPLLLGAALAGCASQSSPIGVIDLTRIQQNWPKFINYSNQLAADTQAIQQSNASSREKEQQLNSLRQRYAAMQDEVTGDLRGAAQQIASQRHLSLIVTRQFVGYGGVDITPDVEKILDITEKAPSK